MKRNYFFSFAISFLLFWAICYFFNSVVLLGKIAFSTTLISPWLTFTSVMKYIHLGMGVPAWMGYILAALLLAFLWVSLYLFVFSLIRAIQLKYNKR